MGKRFEDEIEKLMVSRKIRGWAWKMAGEKAQDEDWYGRGIYVPFYAIFLDSQSEWNLELDRAIREVMERVAREANLSPLPLRYMIWLNREYVDTESDMDF